MHFIKQTICLYLIYMFNVKKVIFNYVLKFAACCKRFQDYHIFASKFKI